VSRELAATDAAVVTVGALRAGTKENIIPDEAELLLSVRTFDYGVRERTLAAIERVVRAEAAASGATVEPEISVLSSYPPVINDAAACAQTTAAFDALFGPGLVLDPGPVTGSEDVGVLAQAAGAPIVYWLLGGAEPAHFAGAASQEQLAQVVGGLPSNHSPHYYPVPNPTIEVGVGALVAAARNWLG